MARQEAAAATDELEQARMVRTRLEKEKKFLSEEAQALRKELLLLEAGGGGGGGKGQGGGLGEGIAAAAASSLASAAGR